ncbi:MAG: GNAT family N-acetyltransferase [Actinomycetota bacterium]|nr:GNAT family N-acetyltransferase [Actinomycetota bacterium]
MLANVALTDLVRHAALFPETDLPPPLPEHPSKQVRRDGYMVGLFPGRTHGTVSVEAVGADDVERAVRDVRSLLAENGKARGAWFVPEAASPAGLAHDLRSLGMVPFDEPPLEPRFAAMALVAAPEPGPPDIEARVAESFEEYQAGLRVSQEAFAVSSEDRAALEGRERRLWEIEQSWGMYRSFVALIDGEVVGAAAVIHGANAAFLAGGSTRADMRGRGVYRALVRARWDAGVARGTPALTVGAGRMSRPILEQLGFATVGCVDCLLDQFS